jgi:hypothetical protein
MARAKGLNNRTGFNCPSHQTDRCIKASVGGQGGQALKPLAYLAREVAHHGC